MDAATVMSEDLGVSELRSDACVLFVGRMYLNFSFVVGPRPRLRTTEAESRSQWRFPRACDGFPPPCSLAVKRKK